MEPFEILVGMIRDNCFDEIGGSPQIAKVYQFMNSIPHNVYWPSRESGLKNSVFTET
jgi:hypothetical protein